MIPVGRSVQIRYDEGMRALHFSEEDDATWLSIFHHSER
jgi:hypothetical protein